MKLMCVYQYNQYKIQCKRDDLVIFLLVQCVLKIDINGKKFSNYFFKKKF